MQKICGKATMVLMAATLGACASPANTAPASQSITAPAAARSLAPETASGAASKIHSIKSRPDVHAAMQMIEKLRARNIDRLIAITQIPAPPFGETRRAKDFAERIANLGITDVTIDEVGNVIARRPGTKSGKNNKRTIAVVAHIDTVFPEETDVTVRREGDTYYAPGIGDNSQGMVLLLNLIEVMEAHNLQTREDILFVGSVGEEGLGDLRGVRHLFRDGARKIDAMIAIDGSNDNRIVTQAVGSNRYRVTFAGPGGHSYGAFGRAHPHQALALAIDNFQNYARPITASGTKATFSVGRIGGGTSINSIPFDSWMEVDMRSTDPAKLDLLDAAFQRAVQDALVTENARRKENDPLTVDIKSVGLRPAGKTENASSLVRNAAASLRAMGIEPKYVASSTDANIPMSLSIPAITISRGGISKNAHAPDESWQDVNSHIAIQAALLTLLAEAE